MGLPTLSQPKLLTPKKHVLVLGSVRRKSEGHQGACSPSKGDMGC